MDVHDYIEWKAGDLVGPVVHGLDSRDIDISGSPTIMTHGRVKYVDYIYHIWPYRWLILNSYSYYIEKNTINLKDEIKSESIALYITDHFFLFVHLCLIV